MDTILCDELLQEIFRRLPPPSFAAVSLVCKRWLYLLRSSTTSLSLSFIEPPFIPLFTSFLRFYPYLSTVSVTITAALDSSDHLLYLISSSCPNLKYLKFLSGPVSHFSLVSLSASCPNLVSLAVTLFRPLNFMWLASFNKSLKELSVYSAGDSRELEFVDFSDSCGSELNLESLLLTGIKARDKGVSFLWRNCKKVRTLKLKSCESVGDQSSFLAFLEYLEGLETVELRTCRAIVDGVLLKLAENCGMLNSLLLYDGGSKEGLLHFLSQSKCCTNLQKLDLRLPLDLDNSHLTAAAENLRSLRSLRLQSCCLVTGEGLKILGNAMANGLEELALINCDVVERESGLLSTLGQELKKLRKLDLSFNDMLIDKELISMLVSCNNLIELKLRGCNKLTNLAMVSLAKYCKKLESVDVMYCCGIESQVVELFVLNSPKLRRLQVEEIKVSDVARTWASNKFIEIVY
ncbi:F-box protein At5g51370-like [Nicotiana tabacum]|uniref:F-box protein At5g51370-like n=1 Tax=Nicotiana tabacum TaxID=4097 RepID=A0A1S3ZZY0_TOBAC|nr:PREDICTED: F-box/LRR-repeat protein 4-like [Nicotiana tabacum]